MSEEKPLLEASQVNEVFEFARAISDIGNGNFGGYYTPWNQNSLLNDLNNNAKVPTIRKIKEALSNYKNSADNLKSYIEFMQKWDMMFAKTLNYYAGLLSYDLEITCTNAFTEADWKSKEYLEDKRRIDQFTCCLDFKTHCDNITKNLLRDEVAFMWFRRLNWNRKNMKLTMQTLPQERCLITGYWGDGNPLFDFDMNYFLVPGVDINTYDKSFLKYYSNTFLDGREIDYIPSESLRRRDGTFAMYTQTSPYDGAWCFKLDLSNLNTTPYLAPLLKDSLRNEDLAQMQYNKDIAGAYAILAGEIRLLDSVKSGQQRDQYAISPKQLGAFMKLVKDGLPSQSNMSVVAMPTENTDFYQYNDDNTEAYSSQLKSTGALSASASGLIYSDTKMSSFELENAIMTDFAVVAPVYRQYSNFMEFWANQLTKKYKFKFNFKGCNRPFAKDRELDQLIKLADKGIVLNSSSWASAIGMSPVAFEKSMEEAKYGGFTDKLTMLFNAHTMSQVNEGGRPKIEGAVDDSTESSRNV